MEDNDDDDDAILMVYANAVISFVVETPREWLCFKSSLLLLCGNGTKAEESFIVEAKMMYVDILISSVMFQRYINFRRRKQPALCIAAFTIILFQRLF